MAVTVVGAMVVTLLLPNEVRAGPRWLLPSLEGLLLVAMCFGDPWRIDRHSPFLKALDIGFARDHGFLLRVDHENSPGR